MSHSLLTLARNGDQMRRLSLLFLLAVVAVTGGCDPRKPPFGESDKRPEIMVFAAMAVSDPVAVLVKEYNNSPDCRAAAIYGGSTHLANVIEVNQKGDVFIPGVGTYIDDMENRGLVSTKYNIGFYTISMYVAKGNSLGIKKDLSELYNPELRVGIGDDVSSGIGRSTRQMLTAAGIYDRVTDNAVLLSSDSKQLINSLAEGKTDLVLDWSNLINFGKYSDKVEKFEIDSPFFTQVPITAGILKFSSERKCAEDFIKLMASPRGKAVFDGYDMAVRK